MTLKSGVTVDMRVERVEEPAVFAFTWPLPDLREDDPRRTYVEFTAGPPRPFRPGSYLENQKSE